MSRYRLTQAAEGDIAEIAEHIATRSTRNALKVANKLYDTFARVAAWPGIGHVRSELRDDSLRVTSLYKLLIIYDPTIKPLTILRVVHGHRDLRRVRPR